MPSSNGSPEERLRKLEQEMAFLRAQGLSPDEHDRILESDQRGGDGVKGRGNFLLVFHFLITLGILGFLIWKEWNFANPPKTQEETEETEENGGEKPMAEPLPFLLPSRK